MARSGFSIGTRSNLRSSRSSICAWESVRAPCRTSHRIRSPTSSGSLPMNDKSLLVCGVTFPLKKPIQTELSTTIKAAPQASLLQVNIERNFAKKCAHAGLLPCADQQLQPSLDRRALGWQAAQLDSLGNQTVIDVDIRAHYLSAPMCIDSDIIHIAALDSTTLPGSARQDPKRTRQCGEVGYQCQHERRCRHHAELPHRRKIREREREKAAGVDERCEQNRTTRGEHRVLQRTARGAARAAFLKMIEKMHLIVLGRSQHGRADENRGNVERNVRHAHDDEHRQNGEK